MKKVVIIGVGSLGVEIAKGLKKRGYTIYGTTTTESKKEKLSKFCNQLILYKVSSSINELLPIKETDYLIITIPPSKIEDYSEKVTQLIQFYSSNNSELKVIYTSSISVYGSGSRKVDESSSINPETTNAKKIKRVEDYLLTLNKDCIILRLAGLVGSSRHPIRYLSGRVGVAKPLAGVNLVHEFDICQFIIYQFNTFFPGVYNLCCQEHPSKKEYYNWVASKKDLEGVEFDESDKMLDKVVICKSIKKTGFKFKYQSPYDFPI